MTCESELDEHVRIVAPPMRRYAREVHFRRRLGSILSHHFGFRRGLNGNGVRGEQILEQDSGIGQEEVERQRPRSAIADRDGLFERLIPVKRRFHRTDTELDGRGIGDTRCLHSRALAVVVTGHQAIAIGQSVRQPFILVFVPEKRGRVDRLLRKRIASGGAIQIEAEEPSRVAVDPARELPFQGHACVLATRGGETSRVDPRLRLEHHEIVEIPA